MRKGRESEVFSLSKPPDEGCAKVIPLDDAELSEKGVTGVCSKAVMDCLSLAADDGEFSEDVLKQQGKRNVSGEGD